MRPEDVVVSSDRAASSAALPIDVALEALHVELERAGVQARRMLNGKRQPTRYFSLQLRQALLESLAAQSAAGPRHEPVFGEPPITRR